MKKFILASLLLFCFSFSLFSQVPPLAKDKGSYAKNFTEGNLNILDFEYVEALKYFMFAYKYDSTNANINYKIGQCYLQHPIQKHLAENYLEKAIQNVSKKYIEDEPKEKHASIMAYFFLGQSYHLDGRLDEATKMYDTYESYLNPKKKFDKEDLDLVEHFKKQVKNAREMMMAPVNVKVVNLGDSINSIYNELSPVITADEQVIYYTRAIPDINGDPSSSGTSYIEQIVTAYKHPDGKWSKPTPLSPYVNTGHEAAVNLSPDGQTLIIFRGDVGSGDLYFTSYDGKDWGIPQKFGSNINTEFWEPHAALSRDGNTLYFVSDRPGGLGGRDIYRCVKLPNGQWSLAQNVGAPINTQYDEDGPFLGADGITFYFATNSDKSMGGFDIMFSIIDENGKFSEPMNMGYPVNTTDDDLFFVVSPDNKRFYFSSGHEEIYNSGVHEKGYGEKDIYMGKVDLIKENPLALFRGRFVPGPCDSLPDDILILVTSVSTGEVIGTYRPNRKTGTFSVIIPPGSKYLFTYQQGGADLYSDEVFVPNDISYEEIQKAINLKPLKICPGMVINEDTTKKDIILNVLVLNNHKEQKPVGKAEVKLQHKGAKEILLQTDENGRVTDVKLESEKSYELSVTANGKSSSLSGFNTIGIKENKTIEKIIYLEKAEGINFKLNLTVQTNKAQHKPVAGVKVKIKGTDGSTQEGVTNEKGKVAGIILNASANYEIDVEKDGAVVSRGLVSTNGLRKSKTIEKVLYLKGGDSEVPDNSEVSGDCFSFYFKYNMNEVDESAPEYKQFIDKLVELKNAGGKITLTVNASASTVPSKKYKDNQGLAAVRGNGTIEKIKNSLKQKGVAESDIVFASNKAFVSGPDYKGDYANTDRYGKFQYVKVCIVR
ncbi:MAG TPA: hypothetical protein VNZ49_11220 [Bacteroidia bacterium]|nr:hypothetical protein [Bacteroidia bacterium]